MDDVMIRFVVIGQKASASEEFLLDDLPGSSGRLDVLLRCLRAAMLSSHGLRRDVVVYLVLLGGVLAPRVMRVDGSKVQFLRPDERALAVLAKKVLASRADEDKPGELVEIKPGIALARGGIDVVLADATASTVFVLDEAASDLRDATNLMKSSDDDDVLFVLGDHLGIPGDIRTKLDTLGAQPLCVGPVSIHADDVVAIVTNELDRRVANAKRGSVGSVSDKEEDA